MLCKTSLVVALLAVAMHSLLRAQSSVPSHSIGCVEGHRTLVPQNPRLASDGTIIPGQALVQARFTLDERTTVRFVEYPRTGRDGDTYNSTIIIQRGQEQKRYAMGRLMKEGGLLRIVEAAIVCTASTQGSIFLAFGTFATGASEGFAVIRYSSDTVDVQVLPWAEQGRIVVHRSAPDEVELWSATGDADRFHCDLCPKYYSVQDCHAGQQNIECKPRPGPRKVMDPSSFEGARIEVR
jgi:hypothetical protein